MRAARVASAKSRMSNLPTMGELWIEVLQQVYGRTAHELKGALNGVSVNLEVVRSRADRPDTPSSAVSPYAAAASNQLDVVIALADAVLALGRSPREPVDIGLATRHLATLLSAAARADGRRLEIDRGVSELGHSSASGLAVRATVGACLLAAIDASTHVRCSVGDDRSSLRIMSCDDARIGVSANVIAAAADAAIRIESGSAADTDLSITFPR